MQNSGKRNGRPSDYSPELANEICDAIACSSKGLRRLCLENKHWPERRNIYHWLKKHEEFQHLYARAKEWQIESLVDEILDIADDGPQDYATDEENRRITNHENIQRAKLKIDTRKWLAAKLCPRIYGDSRASEKQPEDLISLIRDKIK